MTVPANTISLWWPVGLGPQPLYTVTVCPRTAANAFENSLSCLSQVTFQSDNGAIASDTRSIGFRVFYLVSKPGLVAM
jgi:hypothetical protein